MKEESMSAEKSRIGTRSTGRLNRTPSRSLRAVKSVTSSPRSPLARTSRSLSPGTSFLNLRTKRARLDKEKETLKTSKPADTTTKHVTTPNTEQTQSGSQGTQSGQASQTIQNTSKGAGIRTRLSTGSIHMNGTMTISAAKEKAEMDQIMKQIANTDSFVVSKAPTTLTKKRVAQAVIPPPEGSLTDHPPPKKRKIGRNDGSGEENCNDYFCWLCHKEGMLVCCELCPRVYHTKCLGLSAALPQDWVCPECEKIMRAECVDTRSKSMEMLTIEQLCTLLKYALERMKHAGSEPFQKPVDLNVVPNYFDYIFHPMDLSTLEKNIKKKMYGCTEALLADAKWILHNCIIYNGAHSKLTSSAKMIIKICKHEMNEIELCPDCYLNSCVRQNDDWFSETCRVPHTLVWAKLKGYPFWPSKALREVDGQVDVRFFGAHDRSWVSVSQCFLLSKNIPTSLQKGKKNNGLDMAIEELNLHVKKLRERFGSFEYAPFRTPYDKTDSYKPISQKPEPLSKSTAVLRLTQNRDSKSGISSSFASHKPNILRKSAVAKIRNKYSAMVSLKKLDITPEKGRKRSCLGEEVENNEVNANSADENFSEPIGVDDQMVEPGIHSDVEDTGEEKDTENISEEIKSDDDRTKEKIIKKNFVSSNLIERIESKLKALDEPLKETMPVDSTENTSDTSNSASKESKLPSTEESLVKEIEKEIDKTEADQNELKPGEIVKDKSPELTSEVDKAMKTMIEGQSTGNIENKVEEDKSGLVIQDKEPDKVKEDVSKNENNSKDSYRKKLDTMIKSCKEKLGMDNTKTEEIDSAVSDDGEEDVASSEEEDDESDDDSSESENEDSSEKSKNMEEIGTGLSSSNTEDSIMEEESRVVESTCEGSPDEESKDKMLEQQKCEAVAKDLETATVEKDVGKETESKSSTLTSKLTHIVSEFEKTNKSTESDLNKIKSVKSDELNVDKSEIVTSVTVADNNEISPSESKTQEVNSPSSEKKTKSVETDVSTSCVKESSKQSDLAEGTIKSQTGIATGSGKILDPFLGELSDKTGVDEDSDTDRLVIDLEAASPTKQPKAKTTLESKTKRTLKTGTVTVPEVETINVDEEINKTVKQLSNYSSNIKNKSEEKIGGFSVENKAETGEKLLSDSRRLLKKAEENLSIKVRRQSKELECKAQSNELREKTQSEVSKEKTQSGESTDKTHSKKSTEQALSQKSPVTTLSNEEMEVDVAASADDDDDVELLDDLSDIPLVDSDLPVNTDSSLPDKNFVRPTFVDIPKEAPSSGKLAEKFSQKLLKTIQTTMDDMYTEVMKEKNENRTVDMLNKKLNQVKWDYCQELNELKHNFQLTMYEMKTGWESEKEQIVKALTAKHTAEKELAVKETKKKQWCAQCGKEAIFYCCWNTSYCDYPCQQSHWPQHMHTCLQTNKDKTAGSSANSSQSQVVSQSASSTPVTAGPSVTPQTSVSTSAPPAEQDHLRQLQDNISRAIQREEEKRGEARAGVSPKFNVPVTSPVMQNIRQPTAGGMMFNMQPPSQPGVMQQLQRTRFIGQQQQMAMHVQQRASLPQSQQGNPRMLFSQPLIQHAVYPLQVQPQQQLGGTILFQNAQQMSYGMPPRPY